MLGLANMSATWDLHGPYVHPPLSHMMPPLHSHYITDLNLSNYKEALGGLAGLATFGEIENRTFKLIMFFQKN